MFFREKQLKTGTVLQLVESYRNEENQPRQRLVVSIGNAAIPREWWREIADRVEARLHQRSEQAHLSNLEHAEDIGGWVESLVKRIQRDDKWQRRTQKSQCEAIDGVIVEQVNHSSTTVLGPSLLGLHAWNELGMDELLRTLGFNESQREAAAALTINRICEPTSEHALPSWLKTSSLPDLIGEGLSMAGKDRFYRVGDRLFDNRATIESHLRDRQAQLFNLERTVLLYDLTNTHFEGVCGANPKAKRGKNKQKRNDCPQIVIGMVFDAYGFELAHQTFDGSMHDGKSLIEMIRSLDAISRPDGTLAEGTKPLVAMDSGVATETNRRLLRANGYAYIVSHSRPGRRQWQSEFGKGDFSEISGRDEKSPVSIRAIDVDIEETYDGEEESYSERLVLCKSEGRRLKESAIRSKAEERYITALEKLQERIAGGRLKQKDKIHQAIGRVRSSHPRVARFYGIHYNSDVPENEPKLTWERKTDHYDKDDSLLGCYILRCWQQDLSAEQIWTLYMALTQAEEGFKQLKGDLGLRPNFHKVENRVDSHIFITVLGYQLLRYLLFTLSSAGDNRKWKTLRRILSTHCYSTVILPTKDGTVHHIRKPGLPDAAQREIYDHFNIDWTALPSTHIQVEPQARRKATL